MFRPTAACFRTACNKCIRTSRATICRQSAVVIGQSWRCSSTTVPFRKQLKEEAKLRKAVGDKKPPSSSSIHDGWELTVGIEIHAQLNSARKLFSSAPTSISEDPNTHIAPFDLSIPGSQPMLQREALLPALRAAAALNCNIQLESSFDRKHYFYQDQPAGYQITQYYAPFAKDGYITLTLEDGIDPSSGLETRIGIKQVQIEQDTAKSVQQPPDDTLLDFNRAGHPLIEIITLPHIHSPRTAAACVRKIQDVLESVDAVTTGMEFGGLRADVNVSVRRSDETGVHVYAGVGGLGQRTEIKNLSSVKAVEDAIIAEQNRQIAVLEAGGTIEGETRGWTLGSAETRKLRGKEGEVDYRYMSDPDIPSLLLNQELVHHIKNTLPMLPDETVAFLTDELGITAKDARTLVVLDRGLRLDYLSEVLSVLGPQGYKSHDVGKTASNWILHELGGLLKSSDIQFEDSPISARDLAGLIHHLSTGHINGQGAKSLLNLMFHEGEKNIDQLITQHNLAVVNVQDDVYISIATELLAKHPDKVQEIRNGKMGKLQWLVGLMMRTRQGMDAKKVTETLKRMIDV